MRVRTRAVGWCASRTWTRRAACRAQTTSFLNNWPNAACCPTSRRSTNRSAAPSTSNALDSLTTRGLAYPCACTRQDIARALAASGQTRERHGELVYPGTCRGGLHGRSARAWRLDTQAHASVGWQDRLLGPQSQDVAHEVGDFVLKRADGLWAYQLAVVVDDAAQGITDIVRGEDLADNTARQILLQRALGLPLPRYLHTPLVLGANGEKLSKQNGAQALDTREPLALLGQAGAVLGLPSLTSAATPQDWLRQAVPLWAERLKIKR
jgi:glutamyl-Q tRNA(Asp) synthetase